MPKVFIGVPCGEFTRSRTAACITALVMSSPVQIGLKWGFAGDVVVNQNLFAHWTLETKSDYLLLVETDMVFPPDALNRLLAHQKDIVGVFYRHRQPPHDPMLWPRDSPVPRELIEHPAVPSGLMLIDARVLRALSCPWFVKRYTDQPNVSISSDRCFCDDATAAGFHVFADGVLSYEVRHIGSTEIPLSMEKTS